jgi:hypothetical protein
MDLTPDSAKLLSFGIYMCHDLLIIDSIPEDDLRNTVQQ